MNWSDRPLTVEEYLELERTSPVKHEFVNGWAYEINSELAGHNRIARRIATHLEESLPEESEQVFALQTWLKVSPEIYYYPDVAVVAKSDNHYLKPAENPALVIEVLSPSTERVDRSEKCDAYRQIAGLMEYLLVAQDEMWVAVCRQQNGDWRSEQYTQPDQTITLASVGITISLAQIYHGLSLNPNPEEEQTQ